MKQSPNGYCDRWRIQPLPRNCARGDEVMFEFLRENDHCNKQHACKHTTQREIVSLTNSFGRFSYSYVNLTLTYYTSCTKEQYDCVLQVAEYGQICTDAVQLKEQLPLLKHQFPSCCGSRIFSNRAIGYFSRD